MTYKLKNNISLGDEKLLAGATVLDKGDFFVVSPSHIEGLPEGAVPLYDKESIATGNLLQVM